MYVTRCVQLALSFCLVVASDALAITDRDCDGDLNLDGGVDAIDLGLLFADWMTIGADSDLDGDGVVDARDLAILLAAWGDCLSCDQPRHVHGSPRILAELHDGGASVLMLGDSISNWGSTQFTSLFHGAICSWKPVSWRGVYTSPASGMSLQGHYVGFGSQSAPGLAGAFPGLASDLSGHYTAYAEAFGLETGMEADATILRAGLSHSMFDADPARRPSRYGFGRPFENAAGDVDFVNVPGPVEVGFTFLSNGEESAEGRTYASSFRIAAWRSQVLELESTPLQVDPIAGAALERATIQWSSAGANGTESGAATEVRLLPVGTVPEPQVVAVQDFYFGRPDHVDGLTLAYAGYGGWTVGHHVHPMTGSEAPSGAFGYSDEAIRARIKAVASTHYFIHLGTNDFGSPSTPVHAYLDDFAALLDRVRENHVIVRKSPPRFIILGLYLTGQDDEAIDRPRKEEARSALMAWADASTDLVYLDLMGRIEELYDMSDIEQANPFAVDMLWDQVHPNAAGAEFISSWIWSRVEAAVSCGW